MAPQRLLIIGSGIAGLSAANAARKQNPQIDITILGQEDTPPFYRLRLCERIGNDQPVRKPFYPSAFMVCRKQDFNLLLSHNVLSVS